MGNTKDKREHSVSGNAGSRAQGRSSARGRSGRLRRWFTSNRSDLRFLAIFALCMTVYYLTTMIPVVKDGFFPAYLKANAFVSGGLLNLVGEEVTVSGKAITAPDGRSIQVERGCDAIEPSALFVSAVLASPVPLLSRLGAAAAGTLALMVLNLIRVVSLFLVRIHFSREVFDTMHLDVWQALFIFLAIVFWAMWASRAARQLTGRADVAT